jgi:hypothetical protein
MCQSVIPLIVTSFRAESPTIYPIRAPSWGTTPSTVLRLLVNRKSHHSPYRDVHSLLCTARCGQGNVGKREVCHLQASQLRRVDVNDGRTTTERTSVAHHHCRRDDQSACAELCRRSNNFLAPGGFMTKSQKPPIDGRTEFEAKAIPAESTIMHSREIPVAAPSGANPYPTSIFAGDQRVRVSIVERDVFCQQTGEKAHRGPGNCYCITTVLNEHGHDVSNDPRQRYLPNWPSVLSQLIPTHIPKTVAAQKDSEVTYDRLANPDNACAPTREELVQAHMESRMNREGRALGSEGPGGGSLATGEGRHGVASHDTNQEEQTRAPAAASRKQAKREQLRDHSEERLRVKLTVCNVCP